MKKKANKVPQYVLAKPVRHGNLLILGEVPCNPKGWRHGQAMCKEKVHEGWTVGDIVDGNVVEKVTNIIEVIPDPETIKWRITVPDLTWRDYVLYLVDLLKKPKILMPYYNLVGLPLIM